MLDRKEETKIVKKALSDRGIKSRVTHGNGTAWGWLEVYVGPNPYAHLCSHYGPVGGCSGDDCLACKWYESVPLAAKTVAQQVTGRKGEYGGCINVLTQSL